MEIFKRGEYWCIGYYYQGRRIKRKIAPDYETAKRVLRKTLSDIAENKYLDIQRIKPIRFDEFVEQFKAVYASRKKSLGSYYRNALIPLMDTFQGLHLHEITPLKVEEYKTSRVSQKIGETEKHIAPSTVNRELALLKCIFNRAIEWGKTTKNPVKGIKFYKENNKRDRYLSREEMNKLLGHCASRIKSIVLFAANTGLRKGEIQNLQWQDVNYEQGYITVQDAKSGEGRKVPINQIVKDVLISVMKHPKSPYVFCGDDGLPYNFRKSFETALKNSGILCFRFHDLRHTFASHLVMAGVDLNTVRELLGHKTLEMTLRYSHLSPDHKGRAVELLSSRMGTIREQEPKIDAQPASDVEFEKIVTHLQTAT
ncbi:MAG TPA: site-specific integrase [Candidatus Omnitrophota bacterium]|nr:site-specific integrase [Candidatus Omnitrophota bacterium]